MVGEPRSRSNSAAAGTIGTRATRASKPRFRSSRYRITPEAASKPKALPPVRSSAWISCTVAVGARRSVSRVAGAPPPTATPARMLPASGNNTVQPVSASRSCQWPIRIPGNGASVVTFSILPSMPALKMLGMGPQIGARLEEGIVVLQIQMVALQIHQNEDGRDGGREFPEGVEAVLGLQGHQLAESLAMHLGGTPYLPGIAPRAGGFGMEWTTRTKLPLAEVVQGRPHVGVVGRAMPLEDA